MMPVRLETADGHFVHDGHILPFLTGYPKILFWGERVFLLHEEPKLPEDSDAAESAARLGAPAIYREEFCAAVIA